MIRSLKPLQPLCICLTLAVSPLWAADIVTDLARTASGDIRFEVQGLIIPTEAAQAVLEKPQPLFRSLSEGGPGRFNRLKADSKAVILPTTSITLAPDDVGSLSLTPVDKKSLRTSIRIDLVHRFGLFAITVTQTAPQLLTSPSLIATHALNLAYSSTTAFSTPLKDQPNLTLHLLVQGTPANPNFAVRIPRVAYSQHSMWEAVTELRAQFLKLNPSGNGLNLVIDTWNIEQDTSEVNLDLTDVQIGDALRYVAELGGCQLEYNQHALIIKALSVPTPELLKRKIKLPSGLTQVIAAHSPTDWLTQIGLRPGELPPHLQPQLDQEANTLTAHLTETDHTRLSLLLRLLGATAPPAAHPKPWQRAMSIDLPHVQIRSNSLPQALADLASQLPAKNTPPLVIHPDAIDPSRSAPIIDLDLRQIPLADVLRYLALQTSTRLIAKDDSLVFVSFFHGLKQ